MIAIPNMEKPKSCWNCELLSSCKAMPNNPTAEEIGIYTVMRLKDCPLIEIVTCSECKHLEVINGAKIYAHCPMWGIDFKPFEDDTRTNYCSWGERRTDESSNTL